MKPWRSWSLIIRILEGNSELPRGLVRCSLGLIAISLLISPQLTFCKVSRESSPGTPVRIDTNYGKLPLRFEANQGQTDKVVHFVARGSGYTLFLTSAELVLALSTSSDRSNSAKDSRDSDGDTSQPLSDDVVRIRWLNANPRAKIEGLAPLPGKSHYFVGKDPKQWRTDIPNYAKVRYRDLYPGIDLIVYGNQRNLEYDFEVSPGADTQAIVLEFGGIDNLTIDEMGDLLLKTEGGELKMHKPVVYQQTGGKKHLCLGVTLRRAGHRPHLRSTPMTAISRSRLIRC